MSNQAGTHYIIETARRETGCMLAEVKGAPLRYSPVRIDVFSKTPFQVLAYEGEDRKWFDSYEEAQDVTVRHDFHPGMNDDSYVEGAYWDYQRGDWNLDSAVYRSARRSWQGERFGGE